MANAWTPSIDCAQLDTRRGNTIIEMIVQMKLEYLLISMSSYFVCRHFLLIIKCDQMLYSKCHPEILLIFLHSLIPGKDEIVQLHIIKCNYDESNPMFVFYFFWVGEDANAKVLLYLTHLYLKPLWVGLFHDMYMYIFSINLQATA